jgi:hypothetical protein
VVAGLKLRDRPASTRWSTFQSLVATIGGLVAAILAILQWQASTEQRTRELRFEQARQGRQLLMELFDDDEAKAVLNLLDEGEHTVSVAGRPRVLSANDMINVLSGKPVDTDAAKIITEGLDALLYHMALIDHWITTGLVRDSDVLEPLEFYADRMAHQRRLFEHYVAKYGPPGAVRLLKRYPSWHGVERLQRRERNAG